MLRAHTHLLSKIAFAAAFVATFFAGGTVAASQGDMLIGGKLWSPSRSTWANEVAVSPGDTLTITLYASNFSSNDKATSVRISDAVPSHTSYIAGSALVLDAAGAWKHIDGNQGFPFSGSGISVSDDGTLDAYETSQYKYAVRVDSSVPSNVSELSWAGPSLSFTDSAGSRTLSTMDITRITVESDSSPPAEDPAPAPDPEPDTTPKSGGSADPADILLTHSNLAFSSVATGQTLSKTFTISNSSFAGSDLTVSNVWITSPGVPFSVSSSPFTLKPGQSKQVTVTFRPTQAGTFNKTVFIESNDPDENPASLTVSGTGTSSGASNPDPDPDPKSGGSTPDPADILLTHSNLAFSSVATGQTLSKTFTVSNSSFAGSDLTVASVRIQSPGAPFSVSSSSFTLKPGQSKQVTVTFAPSQTGTFNKTVYIESNDPDENPASLTVSGTGFVPAGPDLDPTPDPARILISHATLAFGNVHTNTTVSKTVTISNSSFSEEPLAISSIQFPGGGGPFQVSSGTSMSISPGTSKVITITFTPQVPGSFSRTLTIASNDQGTPLSSITVTGVGASQEQPNRPPEIIVSENSVSFGTIQVGAERTRRFTILNDAGAQSSLVVSSISVQGGSGIFSVFPSSLNLAPGQAGEVTIRFTPDFDGSAVRTIRIESNDPNRPVATVTAIGSGTGGGFGEPALGVSHASLSFGSVFVSDSRARTFSITNAGSSGDPLRITDIRADTLSGAFSVSPASMTVFAGETRTISVLFSPNAASDYTGTITIFSNDPDRPRTIVTVRGTGILEGAGGPIADGGAIAYPNGTLLRVHNTPTVWYTDTGRRRLVPSPEVFESRFRWEDVIIVPDSANIFALARGEDVRFAPGTLVKEQATTAIYRVSWSGALQHIASPAVFTGRGHLFSDVVEVNIGQLSTYVRASAITDANQVLPGDLVRVSGSSVVYYVMDRNQARIVRPEVFSEWSFTRSMVRNISASQRNQLAFVSGDLYYPNGTLIKGSSNAVYVISDFQKRPIVSGDVFERMLYQWDDIVRVSDSEINRMPTGNLVRL